MLADLLKARAAPDVVREWLRRLGPLVAGNMTAEDAAQRLGAYVQRLDYPLAVYTSDALTRAGKAFEFFPTFAKLCAFLDAEREHMAAELKRCQQIAFGPAKQESNAPFVKDTPEQMRAVSTLLDKAFGDGWRTRKGFGGQ